MAQQPQTLQKQRLGFMPSGDQWVIDDNHPLFLDLG